MFKPFFRWLYHHRRRREAARRLNGKPKLEPGWERFSHAVFRRAGAGKNDLREIQWRWLRRGLLTGIGLALGWFLWQSARVWDFFQKG